VWTYNESVGQGNAACLTERIVLQPQLGESGIAFETVSQGGDARIIDLVAREVEAFER
jgi:hypothetical protein